MIFGAAYSMQAVDQAVADVEALPLKDYVRKKWLGGNAARLLGLN